MAPMAGDARTFLSMIDVTGDGWLSWPGARVRAALGRSGVTASKREGDGATPAGVFPLRALWYRSDRVGVPATGLDLLAITPDCGWSDDPDDPAYNLPVRSPYPARHERLWREDGLYDLLVPLGYNDAPVEPGRGSAIFLHVAGLDWLPTEGCVAISKRDLLALLEQCGPATRIRIGAPPPAA